MMTCISRLIRVKVPTLAGKPGWQPWQGLDAPTDPTTVFPLPSFRVASVPGAESLWLLSALSVLLLLLFSFRVSSWPATDYMCSAWL
jgi:hypothetical protein